MGTKSGSMWEHVRVTVVFLFQLTSTSTETMPYFTRIHQHWHCRACRVCQCRWNGPIADRCFVL